uniref:Uncharacterized protein n=1 Tax=Avena sativa TaxID=4498 RepID=A0ACD5T7B3_AVESA
MALRNLVARTRTSAPAALRLPPPAPRLSPPAGARPRFYSSTQGGQHGKGFNLESATEEEVRRQADLVGKHINETEERLSVYREKIPIIWKDIWGTMRLWVVAGAAMQLMLFADSQLRTVGEHEK